MGSLSAVSGILYSNAIFFFIALIICAFFSFLETTISSIRLFTLKELSKRNVRYKSLLQTMESNPDKILSTILVAKNIADVTTAMLSGYIIDIISQQWQLSEYVSFFLSIGVATIAILIFGEIIPKSIGKLHGERLFSANLWIINLLYYSLYPLSFLTKFARFLVKRINKLQGSERTSSSEQEIQFLIEQVYEEGLIDPEKMSMLLSIFRLSSKLVKEIMVPKNDIVALRADMNLKQALDAFSNYQLSRMPVYDAEFDNMIGMLHQKDLFMLLLRKEDCQLVDIVRPLLFAPTQMRLNELLKEFKEQHMHMAIVINEFGSIDGLVTLEDILEEIVGEISDEYKEKTPKMLQVKPGGWLVDGSIHLAKVSSLLHITFDNTQASTLGGFLTEMLQHVPKVGERICFKQHAFQVKKATAKQVLQILVVKEDAKVDIQEFVQNVSEANQNQIT